MILTSIFDCQRCLHDFPPLFRYFQSLTSFLHIVFLERNKNITMKGQVTFLFRLTTTLPQPLSQYASAMKLAIHSCSFSHCTMHHCELGRTTILMLAFGVYENGASRSWLKEALAVPSFHVFDSLPHLLGDQVCNVGVIGCLQCTLANGDECSQEVRLVDWRMTADRIRQIMHWRKTDVKSRTEITFLTARVGTAVTRESGGIKILHLASLSQFQTVNSVSDFLFHIMLSKPQFSDQEELWHRPCIPPLVATLFPRPCDALFLDSDRNVARRNFPTSTACH